MMKEEMFEMDIEDEVDSDELVYRNVYSFTAYCSSIFCGKVTRTGKRKTGEESVVPKQKQVNKSCIDCPDCGYALYWEKKSA